MTTDSPKKEKAPKPAANPVDDCDWSPEDEVNLFYAMRNRRPVGVDRNFQMYFISNKLNDLMRRDVSPEAVWDHLNELYDMEALNDNNSPPSAVTDEIDFSLPSDFDDLKEKRIDPDDEDEEDSKDEPEKEDTPPPPPVSTPVSKKTKAKEQDKPETGGKATAKKTAKARESKPSAEKPDEETDKAEESSKADEKTPATKGKKRPLRTSESSGASTTVTDTKKKSAKKPEPEKEETPTTASSAKKRRNAKKNADQE
ncbi:MRG/MORF4L-binding protein [Halotydeus destructor]|nr:MRG/MORF4L-binding protein [Halotydeus destructor]